MQVLRQEQYRPYKQWEQVLILVVTLHHLLQEIPVSQVKSVLSRLLLYFAEKHFELTERIETTGQLTESDKETVVEIAKQFIQEQI